jgi:hypothetical protein
MDKEQIINFFELASIIIAGGLGLASALTDTKNAKGKLTKWGYIVIGGILASNTFSFVQSFMKQSKEHEEQLKAAQQQLKRDSTERAQFSQQMRLLDSNLRKADSSLKQQFSIQRQTRDVLTQVGQSVQLQKRTFKQSETLTTQQQIVSKSMDRSLHPLLPFKVNLNFSVQSNENSYKLVILTEKLKQATHEVKALVGPVKKLGDMQFDKAKQMMQGGLLPALPEMKTFGINANYPDFENLLNLFTKFIIRFNFSQSPESRSPMLNCEIPAEFLNKDNFKNLQIIFHPDTNTYDFTLEDLPVKVSSELQIGSYSTHDLENKIFKLTVADSPGAIRRAQMVFKFPPDFSRINQIKDKGKGQNVLTKYNEYIYSYTAKCSFLY